MLCLELDHGLGGGYSRVTIPAVWAGDTSYRMVHATMFHETYERA